MHVIAYQINQNFVELNRILKHLAQKIANIAGQTKAPKRLQTLAVCSPAIRVGEEQSLVLKTNIL